jgi:zinc protease
MAVLTLLAASFLSFSAQAPDIDVPYRKFVLDNGLELIVHEDHSDPVVAVYVYYHVGSAREERGRSGFAHLFEHMLFQGSQNIGDDQHFKLVSEAGGTLNGTTNTDRTNYYEVLPSNQLERALWLESDRMGYLLPAMTQAKLDNQRDVVKNERRQNYENRPYGQSEGMIAAALFPPDHPYSWLTIGSHEDLTAASLDDVKGFFRRWYGPNNATLAIAGDVDTANVVALVEKYFGPLPRGPEVDMPAPRPAQLAESKRLVMEDKVKLAQLSFTFPGVEKGHPDAPALQFLASIIASNKSAILDRALTIDESLASRVDASSQSDELAGVFTIEMRANPGTTLDTLESKMTNALSRLAETGIDPDQLERVKTRYEAGFMRRLETVANRASLLADNNTFSKDPARYQESFKMQLAVTPEDVRRVLVKYVLNRPAVVLSVVPEGKRNMAAAETGPATKTVASEVTATLDRTKQPASAKEPAFKAPMVWHATLDNGVRVVGTPYKELPMTTLSLSVPGGRLYESMATLGLSSLTADLMDEGTRTLSTVELSEALDRLGANLSVSSNDDEISLRLSCLDEHLADAVKLLGDVLLQPRFAEADFKRIHKERLVALSTRADQIRTIAGDVYSRLLWGDCIEGMPSSGTRETVEKLTLADIQKFHAEHVVPTGARLSFVGNLDAAGVQKLLAPITSAWKAKSATAVARPAAATAPKIASTKLYLVDKPGAAQSEIRIGNVGVSSKDPNYYPLSVLNMPLGGQFSSRVNLNLREDKGYTYGARTGFDGGLEPGAFTASAGVKTDVTKESVVEFMKELAKIRDGVTDEELKFTKESMRQSALRQYESTMALAMMLDAIGKYGYPDDYAAKRLAELAGMSSNTLKDLAQRFVNPGAMVLLVVGDKAKIGRGLAELGYGEPIELDVEGKPMKAVAGSY